MFDSFLRIVFKIQKNKTMLNTEKQNEAYRTFWTNLRGSRVWQIYGVHYF